MKQTYTNNIALLVDGSGSMQGRESAVCKVVNSYIKHLAKRSEETGQDNRISIYVFNSAVDCRTYNKDSVRLPVFDDYRPRGATALIGATLQSFSDLEKIPELYYDHSFLIVAITDGQNTERNDLASQLRDKITRLPDNWTVACLVPDQTGAAEAKRCGFPAGNIQVWDVNSKTGVEDAGSVIQTVTDKYIDNRTRGIRGTKNLFSIDPAISTHTIKTNLQELSPREYEVILVRGKLGVKIVIKDYVESWTGSPYRVGSAYYPLTKPETIQPSKAICIQEKRNGKVYSGRSARQLLGLPDYEVKVAPSFHADYNVYVQSTSVNRLLVPGTQLIVLK